MWKRIICLIKGHDKITQRGYSQKRHSAETKTEIGYDVETCQRCRGYYYITRIY